MTADHTRRLSEGNEIPLLGLGVWQLDPGPEAGNALERKWW